MYVIDVINESIKLNVTNLNRSYSYRNGTRKCEYIIFFLPQTYYVLLGVPRCKKYKSTLDTFYIQF